MKDLSEIPKQRLDEANFNKFINYHTPRGYFVISACIGAKVQFVVDTPTKEQVDAATQANRRNTAALRQDLTRMGLQYFPVYGTFNESVLNSETQQVYEEVVEEVSFICFPRRDQVSDPKVVAQQLLDTGKELCGKYKQMSFLYKAPGEHQRAYYVTADGQVDMAFDDVKLNDLSQDYASKFTQKSGGTDGKADRRFSYTNKPGGPSAADQQGEQEDMADLAKSNAKQLQPMLTEGQLREGGRWMHVTAADMNEAINRYGEVFFRQ
jgi:hypothetical protein